MEERQRVEALYRDRSAPQKASTYRSEDGSFCRVLAAAEKELTENESLPPSKRKRLDLHDCLERYDGNMVTVYVSTPKLADLKMSEITERADVVLGEPVYCLAGDVVESVEGRLFTQRVKSHRASICLDSSQHDVIYDLMKKYRDEETETVIWRIKGRLKKGNVVKAIVEGVKRITATMEVEKLSLDGSALAVRAGETGADGATANPMSRSSSLSVIQGAGRAYNKGDEQTYSLYKHYLTIAGYPRNNSEFYMRTARLLDGKTLTFAFELFVRDGVYTDNPFRIEIFTP